MSVDNIKFYLSTEQDCSYLPDRLSASVFADPDGKMTTEVYSVLINHGFRRSANFIYRPHCATCDACKSSRVNLAAFNANRNQKRVWKKNADIVITETLPQQSEEHFTLYQKYIKTRHTEGEMDHNDPTRYFDFLNSAWCNTRFIEFRLEKQLIAVAATDYLDQGLSALYTFFDPELSYRSLGTFAILWQIQRAKELNKSWLYLGYWIEECEKMRYKKNFQPLEIFENEHWQ